MAKNTNSSKAAKQEVKGSYAPINGLQMYYEIHGSGKPLVLLHGGLGAIEMFGPNLPALAASRKVIAVDLQAHGRTADIDRPLSYTLMGDDLAALIRYLKLEKADLMGYSLGGGVALQTAILHPEVVRKLVIVSAPIRREGWYPEVLEGMAQMGPASASNMEQSPLYTLYPGVDWATLFTKLGNLLRQDYDWSKDVAALKSPVMIVCADADSVRLAHVLEFFSLLGGGRQDAGMDGSGRPAARLAILPGMTHYNIFASPELAALVAPFLDTPMPQDEQPGSFPAGLAQPARRTLAAAGVQRIEQLTQYSETEIGQWHGIGPKALNQLRRALSTRDLSFANEG